MTTMVYTLNRTTTKSNGDRIPYKLWVGNTPAVHYLLTFGCVTHVKTTNNLKKLDDRSKPTIFVKYESGSIAYHTYYPVIG
jgi:hypothetical protein